MVGIAQDEYSTHDRVACMWVADAVRHVDEMGSCRSAPHRHQRGILVGRLQSSVTAHHALADTTFFTSQAPDRVVCWTCEARRIAYYQDPGTTGEHFVPQWKEPLGHHACTGLAGLPKSRHVC